MVIWGESRPDSSLTYCFIKVVFDATHPTQIVIDITHFLLDFSFNVDYISPSFGIIGIDQGMFGEAIR